MKQTKTVKLIEKIFPQVKDDLKSISSFSSSAPWCNYTYFTPLIATREPDPKQFLEFVTKVENLVNKTKKIVPNKYEISMHNGCSHFDMASVERGLSVGPGYIHIELNSDDEGIYCFSYSGYVWHNAQLIGRILKSGELRYGKVSYGGNFLFNETIDRMRKEREEAKAKKKSNN